MHVGAGLVNYGRIIYTRMTATTGPAKLKPNCFGTRWLFTNDFAFYTYSAGGASYNTGMASPMWELFPLINRTRMKRQHNLDL